MKTFIDLELENRLREEIDKLKEYWETLGSMTLSEKEELREWIVQGNSVNSNPYMLYGENGCLMDIISASRISDDMQSNPEDYMRRSDAVVLATDDEEPF
jgi:hypothetical protein